MADHHHQEIISASSTFTSDVERGGPTGAAPAADSTPDVHSAGAKLERARSAYEAYAGMEEKPGKLEVFGWCFYGLCSYFIYTVLIPVVFPLIISQISIPWPEDNYANVPATEEVVRHGRRLVCRRMELILYQRLTNQTIEVSNTKYSPLEWTSISWGIGLALATPALAFLSVRLDRSPNHHLIAFFATVFGAAFCLPAGFFRTVWIFPPYIAAIVAAAVISSAHHTRHLAIMLPAFTGPSPLFHRRFSLRRAASGWLSISAASTGSLGSAIIAAFTYHMLREKEQFMSLWIVSIFSGLKWLLGSLHFIISSSNRYSKALTLPNPNFSPKKCHSFSILTYPHALGALLSIFLSSLSTMSIFTGAVLYLVGEICVNPKSLLYFWLTYFMFPLISLPALHPIQHLIKANAVKMQLLGFFIVAAASGLGFAGRSSDWGRNKALAFAAAQGTAAGLLYAFGRVLLVDCAPRGMAGAFAGWFVWARAAGSCVGFAVAAAVPGNAKVAFGLGFSAAVVAAVVLIFGNVSDIGGAVAAGHVKGEEVRRGKEEERGSPVNGVDSHTIQETP